MLVADGGGNAIAARHPIVGAARVAWVLARIARKQRSAGAEDSALVRVNGRPGRILRASDGTISDVLAIDVEENGRIQVVRIVRNPGKLAHL